MERAVPALLLALWEGPAFIYSCLKPFSLFCFTSFKHCGFLSGHLSRHMKRRFQPLSGGGWHRLAPEQPGTRYVWSQAASICSNRDVRAISVCASISFKSGFM